VQPTMPNCYSGVSEMTGREAKREYQLHEWAKAITEKSRSGKAVKEWCAENDISPRVYYYRLRQVRERAANVAAPDCVTEQTALVPSGFKAVQIADKSAQSSAVLTVEVGGCRVEVTEETDAELLERVCRVLKTL